MYSMQAFSVSDADVMFCFFRLVCKSTVRAIGLKKGRIELILFILLYETGVRFTLLRWVINFINLFTLSIDVLFFAKHPQAR